jgi:hydrogenase maturation protease
VNRKCSKFDFLWIVGYGNPQRRDDGIGPYAASRLKDSLSGMRSIHILPCHQLDPTLVEDLKDVGGVLFIDATVEPLVAGWQRRALYPSIDEWPFMVHDFKAPLLLGLIKALYSRCPEAWMVSVQGEDFGFGEGLSDRARLRANEAVDAIAGSVRSCRLSGSPNLRPAAGRYPFSSRNAVSESLKKN